MYFFVFSIQIANGDEYTAKEDEFNQILMILQRKMIYDFELHRSLDHGVFRVFNNDPYLPYIYGFLWF